MISLDQLAILKYIGLSLLRPTLDKKTYGAAYTAVRAADDMRQMSRDRSRTIKALSR